MDRIAGLAQLAAVFEASSEKPGNVSPTHSFKDASYRDYLLSAIAMTQGIKDAAEMGFSAGSFEIPLEMIGVGSHIRRCACDIKEYTGAGNTHLGTLMLFVPIAAGAGLTCALDSPIKRDLRMNIRRVLESTTVEDSLRFYEAVEAAGAGGIHGGLKKPEVSFYDLMRISSKEDRIADELSCGLEVVFKKGVPAFNRLYNQLTDPLTCIVQTFLLLLAEYPDTLIAKKMGGEAALDVSLRASYVLEAGGVFSDPGLESIEEFDSYLRSKGNRLNPGATADLVAASVYVWLLKARL